MIFGAFGSDYIRADSVELTVATVSYRHSLIYGSFRLIFGVSKAIVCVQILWISGVIFGHSFIFYRKLGINLLFLLAAGQLCQNFAKSEIYISDKPLQLLPPFVQMSAIVLYCLHYTLQKTRRNCDEREKQKPLLLQQLAT